MDAKKSFVTCMLVPFLASLTRVLCEMHTYITRVNLFIPSIRKDLVGKQQILVSYASILLKKKANFRNFPSEVKMQWL